MATFGNTHQGAGTDTISSYFAPSTTRTSTRFGNPYAGVNGTLDKITVFISNTSATNPITVSVFLSIKDGGGAGVHTQIAAIERTDITTTPNWYDFTASSQALLSSNTYILSVTALSQSISAGSVNLPSDIQTIDIYKTNFTDNSSAATAYSNAKQSPWSQSLFTGINQLYSIYATYTPTVTDGFSVTLV